VAEVRVKSVRKEFGAKKEDKVVALQDISFELEGYVFVSIVGPSGCGKSTLLNVLSGIEDPTSGSVAITQGGKEAKIGYVFQASRLLPWRSVMDNMLFVQKERDQATKERCQRFLDMVHLGDKTKKYPGELSGGMQQRVGIARAFSIEPDLLLMDEPFSHLDAITARGLRRELYDIWKTTKKTVVFVTHDVGEAIELSTRVILLGMGGKLVDDFPLELPFPREASDENVALAKAHIMKKFEELDLIAS
jgi:NitT/TauT family transport system ATP-binding protein